MVRISAGIVIDPELIDHFHVQNAGKKLSDHALILTKADANGQIEYYAGYGWARAKEITTIQKWQAYLAQFAKDH
ncbi:DUF4861 domain-containing protein [Puniceicoccaceae bacterium]|nr:DUF4861 domain-containing protein [Puniceicoccaceae bacterium]